MIAPEQLNHTAELRDGLGGVAELAEARLRSKGFPALWNICCEYHNGTLTLRGCVPTYHVKQVALAAVARLEGVEHLADGIEVRTAR
jgi:osmotically-inducible protein OsmY